MAAPIVPTPIRWPLSFPSETVASDHVSAACYRRTEDIDVLAIVIPELKFRCLAGGEKKAGLVRPASNSCR